MATAGDDTAQPPPKRPRHEVIHAAPEDAAAPPRVRLNPADCSLDFEVGGGGGLLGRALHEGVCAYCWSGARATVGVRGGGRYCFGCRVVAEQAVEMEHTEADQRHLCRVGVSRGDDPVGRLGESGHSFGFGGTGKLSHRGMFFDYGAKFGVGDIIACAVDLDSKRGVSIGFSKNGKWLGVAHCFDAGFGPVDAPVMPMQWDSAIFPHVLLKNVVVEMQFSREDGLEPVEGYEPWSSASDDGNAVLGPVFAEQQDLELLMMVGLPASGKTTWAEKWVKEHPEKRFVLLGTNLALQQMQLTRFLSKHDYDPRIDCWMERATAVLKTFLDRASNIPRNYIIDQLHLNQIERIRNLSPFVQYNKTAVVVFPSLKNLQERSNKRFLETWIQVPHERVYQLAATFVLPLQKETTGSLEAFNEVLFVDLSRDTAQRVLDYLRPGDKHGSAITRGRSGYRFQPTLDVPNQHQIQSSSNARDQPISAKDIIQEEPVEEDFIMFRKFDLYEEFESMDIQYEAITELSNRAESREEVDALWEIFRGRIKKCREIQREIRSARGSPPPIPDWFLTSYDSIEDYRRARSDWFSIMY